MPPQYSVAFLAALTLAKLLIVRAKSLNPVYRREAAKGADFLMDTDNERTDIIDSQKPPVKAGWICLMVTWAFFIIPIPGLGLIGWAFNLAAFILSIIVMVKGRVGAGVAQLVCSLVVSPIIYMVGLGILGHLLFPRDEVQRLFL